MSTTADGIDHGKSIITDCFEAVVEKFEDGYMLCVLNATGVKCEECMEVFEQRIKKGEQDDDGNMLPLREL